MSNENNLTFTRQSEAFWQKTLAGIQAPTPLIKGWVDQSVEDQTTCMDQTRPLTKTLTESLQSTAQLANVPLKTLVLGTWALLLSRYSGEETVIFGATWADRDWTDTDIKPLPVCIRVVPDLDLSTWLPNLHQQWVAIKDHDDLSLTEIQKCSEIPANLPLFETLVVFEDHEVNIEPASGDDSTERQFELASPNHCPLSLYVTADACLQLTFKYEPQRFDAATINRMIGHFQTLLEGMAATPNQNLSELPLLTEEEQHQLLVEWNNTQTEYPQDSCIHQLFERQVEQTPEAVAVVFEEQQLTYRELNSRANQLAHYLHSVGVKPETLVGLCLERSLEMVIGLLGILKAGGAYLPLDPAYPADRLAFMLGDAEIPVLVTLDKFVANLPEHQSKIVCLDTEEEKLSHLSTANPLSGVAPENLVYVIYTSGSTGKPKGVLIRHFNVARLFAATKAWFNFNEQDIWTLFHSYAFDFSVWELWGALLHGGQLVVVPYWVSRSPDAFYQLLGTQRVTVLNQTPSAFRQQIQAEERLGMNKDLSLRLVIFGGEALEFQSLTPWFERHGDQTPQLVNMYGITETTVHVTYRPLTLADLNSSMSQVGVPIPDLQVYILDRYLQPTPIGIPGELHIGGAGLARGYLNRPNLTAEKFINNPFSDDPEARLYKTGDLARYLADGNIEYLGRIDNQVKIRGFRIELGEIEAVLVQHPEVRDAVVIVREEHPRDKRLVAYLVLNLVQDAMPNTLRQFITDKLPDYMVPSAFVKLEAMPLTPNGKVDRRKLSQLSVSQESLSTETFVAPRTPEEELLAGMLADLLGIEQVGIDDNFFELGGHSLLATQFISQVRDVWQVELPLRGVFETPTVADLAKLIDVSHHGTEKKSFSPIQPIPRDGDLPLSFSQERIWLIKQLVPDNRAYNFQFTLLFEGLLDVATLEQSLSEMVQRHEIYRTTFSTRTDGQPIQLIHPAQPVKLPVVDLRALSDSEYEAEAYRLISQAYQQTFKLTQLPLVHWTLLRLTAQKYILIHVEDHLVHDGWSFNLFIGELLEIYRAFAVGKDSPLAELPIQFADFAHWQRQWMQGKVLETQLAYWQEKLAGSPLELLLPFDHPRPATQHFRGDAPRMELPLTLCNSLKTLGRQNGATLFMTMLAAFVTLMYRYSGQDDICIGSAVGNRSWSETEGLIGMLVNNIVLRTELSGNPSFIELLRRVRQMTLEAYIHQDVPFDKVVNALQPARDMSRNPLFQVMFSFHDSPFPKTEVPGLTVTLQEGRSNGSAKFDLNIIVVPREKQRVGLTTKEETEGTTVVWEYNNDLFDDITMLRMMQHYQILLEGIVAEPEQNISSLPLLTEVEQYQLLTEWNNTATDYPKDQCIHQLFETQVEQTPDAVAVVFEEQQITYRELNRRSNQLAHYLHNIEIKPETLVGLCLERSLEMVIGLLGILKTGGAYLPLDPTYPAVRLAFILEDAQVSVLLTQSSLTERLPKTATPVIVLDAEAEALSQSRSENIRSEVGPTNLAYVIYTSGSTGKPKGVQIQHQSLTNFLGAMAKEPGLTKQDALLAVTTISFDIAALELYLPLIVGAKILLVSREVAGDGLQLLAKLNQAGITVMQATPATWRLLLAAGWKGSPDLKIFIGGEALPQELASQLQKRSPAVWNLYGPTETTIWSTVFQVEASKPVQTTAGSESIGRPIANTQIYLLDHYVQPVPVGVFGELYIGGDGLARGYLNRPELTAEKFINNPFSDDPDARLYKTGDLARYLPDGNIEYLGRMDNQVKIRGFRIELGEIEAVLAQHSEVREVVVIIREDHPGDKRLVAYIVPKAQEVMSSSLRSFLTEKLPNYMVPSVFVQLETMPLTPNGKVDRRALPLPEQIQQAPEETLVVPQDKLEQQLANLWEKVLHVHPIGRHDSFFKLGGHSLLAVTLLAQIEKAFGKGLSMMTLFQAPTIAKFADILRDQGYQATWRALEAIQPQGSRSPLFFIGSTNYARALAPSLGTDQPVYGLNIFGIQSTDGTTPSLTVEWIARQYIQEIQTLQPEGPYYLCGYCGDAKVAFEMAQQLQAQGETIALLAFLDVIWKRADTPLKSRLWPNLLEFGPIYLFHKIQQKVKFFQDRLFLALTPLNKKHHQQAGKALPLELQHKLLINSFFNALANYVPQSYPGSITLFYSREWFLKYSPVLEKRFAEGGTEVYQVPGYHDVLFDSPQVEILGKQLTTCLENRM